MIATQYLRRQNYYYVFEEYLQNMLFQISNITQFIMSQLCSSVSFRRFCIHCSNVPNCRSSACEEAQAVSCCNRKTVFKPVIHEILWNQHPNVKCCDQSVENPETGAQIAANGALLKFGDHEHSVSYSHHQQNRNYNLNTFGVQTNFSLLI